jgi:hypothetical protein
VVALLGHNKLVADGVDIKFLTEFLDLRFEIFVVGINLYFDYSKVVNP